MTNKKFKMAAMSLALTACVAASPLAANAESADVSSDTQTPTAQSEPEAPAEQSAAQEAPAEEPAAAEPEAAPEQEPETSSETEETEKPEESEPEETSDEEPVEEEDASSDAETAEEEAGASDEETSDEEQTPADETSADAAAPSADLLISRPETAFISPMLPAEGAAASTDSPDAQISLLMPMEGEGIAVNAGQASIESQSGITYGTLDDAIANAKSDDTILVYEDVESDGIHLVDKNLTIQGVSKNTVASDDTSSTTVKPKLTFKNGISLKNADLMLKNLDVDMTGIGSTPNVADRQTWMGICITGDSTLTLDHTDLLMDGTEIKTKNPAEDPQGIYLAGQGHNILNIQNDSNLTIKGYFNAIKWNGIIEDPSSSYNINITGNSSLTADHNEAGIVGRESLNVLVEDSTLTITNCTARNSNEGRSGTNGANFTIKNSTVEVSGCSDGYGLHANDLYVKDSTLIANNNGYSGIRITGKGEFINSNVTVSGTLNKGNAAIELANVSNETGTGRLIGSLTVTGGSLNVSDNQATGIRCNTGTSFQTSDTAVVTIRNNTATPNNGWNGVYDIAGGLLVRSSASATLGANTIINNNHAATAGDDIFVMPGGKLTFSVGNATGDGDTLNDEGCGDRIYGWYLDAEGQRWDFHGDPSYAQGLLDGTITLPEGVTLTDNGDGTYTLTVAADAAEGLALKAAHDELPAPEPAPETPDEPENDDPVTPENPTNPPVQDATPDTPVVPENPELPPVQDAAPDAPVLPSDPVLPAVQDARALPQTGTSLFAALAMALSGLALTAAGAWASLTGKRCRR